MEGMKVAGNCMQWQHPTAIHHAHTIPKLSFSLDRRLTVPGRSVSYTYLTLRGGRRDKKPTLRRASSAGFTNDGESDEEFLKRIQQLVLNVNIDNGDEESSGEYSAPKDGEETASAGPHPWHAARPEWLDRDETVPASVEINANRVDLPVSLRIIKRKKKRWEESFRDAGESACCSVKKAFSSMVFIVRELQSYTLQMREALFFVNLEGILARVQEDMNASFVWLFQQIFSCTPTLMVYVMLLLANFTVQSIGDNYTLASLAAPNPIHQSDVMVMEQEHRHDHLSARFDSSSIKTFSIGRTASVNSSGGGGGGTTKPVAGATDDGSYYDGRSSSSVVIPEEEAVVWNRIVEEAAKMQASTRDESLMDHETLQRFVSPVRVEVEAEDYEEHAKTEMMYYQALVLDPDNSLLLSNFAQFLYLALRDHDRAEYYFKRAVAIKPADAESFSRYATFLWLVRKDLGTAEETYLEAISAEPSNSYYAANYAHFLWNTGGEDTCYPLDGNDAC